MPQYSDAEGSYTIEYPESWLPLTDEGSPHIGLASLLTGGYLKIEACRFDNPTHALLRPAMALRTLVEADHRHRPASEAPAVLGIARSGVTGAHTTYSTAECKGGGPATGFGHTRAWVFSRGGLQVRCLYRCRRCDAGADDDELQAIIDSLVLHQTSHLDAGSFSQYYFSVLKRHRPRLAVRPPDGLTLTMSDGQAILLEHLYNRYRQVPERLDELIESHIDLLDFCGDDVPDLANYRLIRPLLFPKLCRITGGVLPPHRARFWPGLAVGAVVRGTVFHYGVNSERLHHWGFATLREIWPDLLAGLAQVSSVRPRGLRDEQGQVQAISYADHPFSASFVLYEDFYETTAGNLNAPEFLVGLPDPGCVSCFREDEPRFVAEHTTRLRGDYHRSVEHLTDTIYLVTGPTPQDARPYDVLHGCVKQA